MRATGIVRRLDNMGRLVLPAELRRRMLIKTDDLVEIFLDEDTIIFKKYKQKCYICGNEDNLNEFKGKCICKNCIENINY